MKTTSPVFSDLKVGDRVKRSFSFGGKPPLMGKVIGFKDLVDLDMIEKTGCTEAEATVEGGVFVVELDASCRPHTRNDDGSTHVISTWDVDYEQAEDWDKV